MATVTSFATPFVAGGVTQRKNFSLQKEKLKSLNGFRPQLSIPHNSRQLKHNHSLSVRAEYRIGIVARGPLKIDGSRGGSGDFVAGFLLGGAIFGTLAYVFAPQIRRSLLNEDEYGFRKAKRPIYYDEGLEKTRQTLNAKISQLNNAIDNVSSRLRGENNAVTDPVEAEAEVEASI